MDLGNKDVDEGGAGREGVLKEVEEAEPGPERRSLLGTEAGRPWVEPPSGHAGGQGRPSPRRRGPASQTRFPP